MNPPDYEHTLLSFYFATDVGGQTPFVRIDFARFQRASKSSEQSAGCRGYNVIDCCGVRFADFAHINAIMLRNSSVNTERHRFFFTWQIGKTQRSFPPFQADIRNVSDFCHCPTIAETVREDYEFDLRYCRRGLRPRVLL
jgi:hypothetical protein